MRDKTFGFMRKVPSIVVEVSRGKPIDDSEEVEDFIAKVDSDRQNLLK